MSTKTTKNNTKTTKNTKSSSNKKTADKKVSKTKNNLSKKNAEKKVEKDLALQDEALKDLGNVQANTEEVLEEKDDAQKEEKVANKKKEAVIKAPRIIPKEEEKEPKKKKKEKDIIFERFNPQVKVGLSADQVQQRISQGLTNVVHSKNTKTYKSIIFGNIFTFFNMLCFLVAVALISVGAIGDCFFMIIVLANTCIGIIQEIKAKKTIEKISLVSSPTALVIRDKLESKIPVSELVLDDIIMLQTGKQICADSIVLEGTVEVNESLLTGESVAVKKTKGDILYSGSFVVGGKCFARVDKIGNDTYTAKLAAQAKQYRKPKSELMGTLNTIIKIIGIVIIPLAILMFMNNSSV